jgi:Tol biopolymer transport system component
LGSLAYGADGDIYVAEWDGSNAVRIADGRPPSDCGGLGEYWGEGPIWSPDGRYLAYRHTNCDSPRDDWWDVVISDSEGNVVAEFPSEGWRISWSPDSTRVAVWVRLFETIGVFGVDGERQALLTTPPGWEPSGDHDPMWLRDGESLLVDDTVVTIDGSTPDELLLAGGTYSPDGSRVAYATRRSLVVAEADGSNPQVVFDDWVGDPVWSPTGDRIAFTSMSGRWRPNELRVLEVATGTVTLLADADGSDSLEVIDFSPEDDRILFARLEDGLIGVGSLWSVNADGSNLRRLVAVTAWGDWLSPGPTP